MKFKLFFVAAIVGLSVHAPGYASPADGAPAGTGTSLRS